MDAIGKYQIPDPKKIHENLLCLLGEFPDACLSQISELSRTENGLEDVAFCLESLGQNRVHLMLGEAKPDAWKALVRVIQPYLQADQFQADAKRLQEIYLMFLAYCLAWDPTENHEPSDFRFLNALDEASFEKILSDENPGEISLLSAIMSPFEMAKILEKLPKAVGKKIEEILQRHVRLPSEVIKEQSFQYLERLRKKVLDERLAKARAKEELIAAIASIDFVREEILYRIIEAELPTVKKLLSDQGYDEGQKFLTKGVVQNAK